MLWLAVIRDVGAGPVTPPIRTRVCTALHGQGSWVTCIWIVYTRQGSVEVLQVTRSLLLQILLYCLVVVYVRLYLSSKESRRVVKIMLPGSLRWLVHSVGSRRCIVTVSIISGAMASGKARGGRFRVDRGGVNFRYELETSWNARESFLILDSPEVVVLDTSVIPDLLGLRAHYPNAESTRVLPGRAQNIVRVLVPDARAMPQGFHDITLVDMTGPTGPTVSMGEMSNLRRQWPTSLLTGMTRRQTDLEALR